jgi:hypothetical protein
MMLRRPALAMTTRKRGQRRRMMTWYLEIPVYVLSETPSSHGVGSRGGDAPLQAC